MTAPSCTISPVNANIVAGTTQQFTASCTNSPTLYTWKVDNVQVASNSIASYTPGTNLAAGAHTVSVTASNAGGTSNTASASLNISAAVAAPVCTISPSSANITAGTGQQFTASCTNSPTLYTWKVDNVQVASNSIASYTPGTNLAAGAHTVSVTASNAGGTSNTASASLNISAAVAAPVCTISPSSANITAGTGQQFTASCTNSPTLYTWKVDNVQVASNSIASYTPGTNLAAGAHTVSVTASNAGGTSNTATATLNVTTAPADTTAPSIPTGVKFGPVSSTRVSLTWGASIDNVGVTQYRIYRDGALLAEVAGNPPSPEFVDGGLLPLTTYSYKVQGCDSVQNCSDHSFSASITSAANSNSCFIQPSPGLDTHYGTVYRTNGMPDAPYLSTGGWGDQYFSLIQFDITKLPSSTNIVAAEIWLYFLGGSAGNDPVAQINRITQPWTPASVSLAQNPTSVYYSQAPARPTAPGWVKIDITQLYRDWKSGNYPNYGIKTVPTQFNNNNDLGFASSEAADWNIRPKIVVTTTSPGCGQAFAAQTPLKVGVGWNLLGNSSSSPMNVKELFGDPSIVQSVWSWDSSTAKWAFYAPEMSSRQLGDYVSVHGFTVLTAIQSRQAFWVNSKSAFTRLGPLANPVGSDSYAVGAPGALLPGWQMNSVGDPITPRAFVSSIQSPGLGGSSILSIWAWDNQAGKWLFFSPGLDALGGPILTDYIDANNLLDFSRTGRLLGPGIGFWLYN